MNRRNLRSVLTFTAIALPGVMIAATGYLQPLAGGSVPRGAEQIRLPATDTVSLCPGPLQATDEAAGTDEEFQTSEVPTPTVRTASAVTQAPDSTLLAAGVEFRTLAGEDNYTVGPSNGFVSGSDSQDEATKVTGVAEDENPALVSAVQVSRADDGDWAGLAAIECVRPVTQARFATTGASATDDVRLVLTNPSETTISVTTEATGSHGPIEIGGDAALSLKPHEQQVVQLGAIAAEEPEVGLTVTADGGLVGAVLQHTKRSGLTAEGIEVSAPTAAPAREVFVPIAAGGPVRLRMSNPNDEPVSVDIDAAGVDGPVDLERSGTSIPARGTVTLDLGEIPPAALTIAADDRISAAAEVTRDSDGGADFAVFPAVGKLNSRQLLMLPEDTDVSMLFGPGDGNLGVVGLRGDGSATGQFPVDLSPDRATEIKPAELLGPDTAGVIIETPAEVDAVAAGAAQTDRGVSALTVPDAPSGIGYRNIRLMD
ncbi:DUF5719 family protein [Brevibacterium otitidis]|uniref:DUF5719 family protein n=1 Tax=Brevibacterium otitidis TaxID=53364 RepID=A0ABV5X1S6_9MICO|nr:DUF5719 family protein [Brevibacterium otitidis]